ncbi:hypothetical protein J4Q44_G00079530 [Coregonus suidteri]|uniref:Uncharacterized protein n=1 Tax=Coregonus suidteri TaxID=861788 RepID=A0AAN8RBM3_9TELE
MKSDRSMNPPYIFNTRDRVQQERTESPVPSCVSMNSDRSMDPPYNFSNGDLSTKLRDQQERSESEIPSGLSDQSHHTDLASLFMSLEENIIMFMKKELQRITRILSPDLPECFGGQREDEEVEDTEDEKQESSAREGALKITLHVLRNMNQNELADTLEKNMLTMRSQQEELDVFDLKKYSRSEEGLLGLLPVVKASRTALSTWIFKMLNGCNLTERCCAPLGSALRSNSSHLTELNLNGNDLQHSGVKLLSAGLEDPLCRLETLRLNRYNLTSNCSEVLAKALSSDSSHLRELDLSNNDLHDSGVKRLTAGLQETGDTEAVRLPGHRKRLCFSGLGFETGDTQCGQWWTVMFETMA